MFLKKLNKRILTCVILLILFLCFGRYFVINTNAKDENSAKYHQGSATIPDKCSNQAISDEYAFKIDGPSVNNTTQIKIIATNTVHNEDLLKSSFVIDKINNNTISDEKFIISKDTLNYDKKTKRYYYILNSNFISKSYNVIHFTSKYLSGCNNEVNDKGKKFDHAEFEIEKSFSDAITEELTAESNVTEKDAIAQGSQLNCSAANLSQFEKSICEAKSKTSEENKKNKENDVNTTFKFKCDPNTFLTDSQMKSDEDYYVNKSYLYHSKTNEEKENYIYNFDDGIVKKEASCSRTCEEGVIVEYGPPVATKAGLCFEYKIKVTSRVRCYSNLEKLEKPERKFNLCTPAPVCYDSYVKGTYRQGGPNEDFDKCVKKCDGGKYTKKCSDKCYKKVYGTNSSTIKTSVSNTYSNKVLNNSISYSTSKLNVTKAEALEKCYKDKRNTDYGGCYYKAPSGEIIWISRGNSFARYYQITTNWTIMERHGGNLYDVPTPDELRALRNGSIWIGANKYDNLGTGIPMRFINNFGYCKDVCSFHTDTTSGTSKDGWSRGYYMHGTRSYEGCGKHYYLNYGQENIDLKNNINTYNRLVDKCNAQASCSTSTAEFTIKVNYTTGKTEKTVKFPYDPTNSDKKDTVATCKKGGEEAATNTKTCVSGNANTDPNSFKSYSGHGDKNLTNGCHVTDNGSSLIGYAGCYSSGLCPQNDYYMTEWTIPGTWMGNKNGLSISYSTEKPRPGWRYQKNKFCTPLDSGNVNEEWWKIYYAHNHSKEKIDEYNKANQCKSAKIDLDAQGDKVTSDKLNWNIIGDASKFGYFNWNIQIQCFYAQFDDSCGSGKSTNARVRTVDLNNLFPGSTADSKKGSSSSATTSESGTSRNIGFNWTSKADITNTLSGKDSKQFISEPEEYLKYVQKEGYNIYNDDNLDYQFTITPSELRQIKNKLSSNNDNYTKFDGTTKQGSGGVSRYTSNLIHGSSEQSLIKSKKVPSDYDCNNMISYKDGCNGGN